MKTINISKILLIFFIIAVGIVVLFYGVLYFQQERQIVKSQDDNSSNEHNITFIQENKEVNIDNNDLNVVLESEKFDFLDKNISEILSLNEKSEDNKTIEQNLNEEQKMSDLSEYAQIEDDIKLDNNITKQKVPDDYILNNNQHTLIQIKQEKPSLAIIIDDMANSTQVKMLKNTKLKLIPSFFPPDKRHPHTAELAKEFDFFMVHLPLAAIKYDKAELNTLEPNDAREKIFKRIAYIKEKFPNLIFINNHTGSLFTSDEKAMKNLFDAFSEYGFIFVDSKTIGNSKASKLAKVYNQPYIARDIFLDNEDDIEYIKKQIIQVVKRAKDRGFAIAIAHPKKNTFEALMQSKELLQSVQLVYLNEIYK
ncbi:polysaccharide deacetylase [Campylobacter insulaenigrae]|uniref:divergent polysaccharide deacetylase family protein n=1 Tax=Campylobacter insulaenigrae TaxID=260714 RepID=UPI000F702EA6|nr:divergent polysaccharide deacetylase family protein [Campylobacter insulaenigrae]MCR6591339.1 divergent polysaccharide deacetylase family protein [Campylobacter insulaenigrae]MCR6592765.1 divergent polysaccharide deacetylase family protein [Campylobacter insulaenigrae]VEJ54014.1 polysaccharide deacetylase [Campylobacter insulaenigrae]